MPMVEALSLDLGDVGIFLGLGHLGAIFASVLLIRLQSVFSDRLILLGSFLLGVTVGFSALFVQHRIGFWLLAVGSGFVITAMGIMCNILVVSGSSRKTLGKTLSGLHGMYGLGSFLGTFLIGQMLSKSYFWSTGFAVAGGVSTVMLMMTVLFFREDQKHLHSQNRDPGTFRWAHLLVIMAFAVYVGAEISVSMWMSPFLTEVKGLPSDTAAYYASLYFLVMSGSRIICALVSSPRIESGLAMACLGVSLIFFFYAYFVDYRFFPLTGLLGPFYPLLYSMMSRTFHRSWRLLASLVNLGSQVFLGIMNLSLGDIGKRFGVEKAYFSGPLLTVVAMLLLGVFVFRRSSFDESNASG